MGEPHEPPANPPNRSDAGDRLEAPCAELEGEVARLQSRCADLEDLVRDLHAAAISAGARPALRDRRHFGLLQELVGTTERHRG